MNLLRVLLISLLPVLAMLPSSETTLAKELVRERDEFMKVAVGTTTGASYAFLINSSHASYAQNL